MMARKTKLTLSIAAAGLVCLGISFLLVPHQKPVYLHDGSAEYKIVGWEVLAGTNVVLRSDYSIKQWGRRQLDKVGVHLKGSRGDVPFSTVRSQEPSYHVLAIHFEGPRPGSDFPSRLFRDYDYVDEKGDKVFLTSVGSFTAAPGWERLLLTYTTSFRVPDATEPPHSCADGECPRQLRIVRKSDGGEVLALRLTR